MILDVQSLQVSFATRREKKLNFRSGVGLGAGASASANSDRIKVIENLSFSIAAGKTLGIVGESGSGKSVASLALMGLLPDNARVDSGVAQFAGRNLLTASESEMQEIRGGEIAMIFQDPMSSLNPSLTIGYQIKEVLRFHGGRLQAETLHYAKSFDERAAELLEKVGITEAKARLGLYPYQLSGGMLQRVMIAMAIASSPTLLIADEPTTALDVTIQAQILGLLKELQREQGMALILITHDIGVIAQMADEILVMYAGQAMEFGSKSEVIHRPKHPYTKALLAALPEAQTQFRARLTALPGLVPDLALRPSGCQLHPRCPFVIEKCRVTLPEWRQFNDSTEGVVAAENKDLDQPHFVRCHRSEEL
jgi:dipeptide transport system ATP-binding protein